VSRCHQQPFSACIKRSPPGKDIPPFFFSENASRLPFYHQKGWLQKKKKKKLTWVIGEKGSGHYSPASVAAALFQPYPPRETTMAPFVYFLPPKNEQKQGIYLLPFLVGCHGDPAVMLKGIHCYSDVSQFGLFFPCGAGIH
jgi:hypothetical protein